MNNNSGSPAAVLNPIAESSLTCKHCGKRLGVVEVIDPMTHGNLIAYPTVITPDYCAHCGNAFTRPGRKKLLAAPEVTTIEEEKPPKEKAEYISPDKAEWIPGERYATEKIIALLGPNSRYWLRDARARYDENVKRHKPGSYNGGLPYIKNGIKINYLGVDLQRWCKQLKPKSTT